MTKTAQKAGSAHPLSSFCQGWHLRQHITSSEWSFFKKSNLLCSFNVFLVSLAILTQLILFVFISFLRNSIMSASSSAMLHCCPFHHKKLQLISDSWVFLDVLNSFIRIMRSSMCINLATLIWRQLWGETLKAKLERTFQCHCIPSLFHPTTWHPFLRKEGSPYYSPQELLLTPVDELGQESKEWSDFHYIHPNISKARNSILPGPVFSSWI